ncbi:MAG: hypothetical protein HOJ88_11910, partial [Proteobacteria bacterium]|nr:hypothetical protein [Pseudomonadota bacterium]
MTIKFNKISLQAFFSSVFSCLFLVVLLTSNPLSAQEKVQALDENGAPMFKVDPFWPGPLPNRWSMQQVTGIGVDHMDHIWFLNRGNLAQG